MMVMFVEKSGMSGGHPLTVIGFVGQISEKQGCGQLTMNFTLQVCVMPKAGSKNVTEMGYVPAPTCPPGAGFCEH